MLREVSPHYISFALDNAFVRDPTGISGVVLPQDQTNSTRINFTDPLLNKLMPLVADGFIRIGGTYTDFVHYYVPGANHTKCPYATKRRCPGNSIPCCLPLTMARWTEALEFAHRSGLQVVFNLNVLHGRFDDYSDQRKPGPNGTRPPWDPSEARALMQWTKDNIEAEKWPAYFGLGNELQNYLTAEQWAHDTVTVWNMIKEIFGGTPGDGDIPYTYGPCNAGLNAAWNTDYMEHITKLEPKALGALSFHGYNHGTATWEAVASMSENNGLDSSRTFFQSVVNMHSAADTNSKLWITETAWSARSPANAPAGGALAAVDGMCRAADIAWNLDALGAAAEVGIDVFCRETLAGDWLEVIGLWQPGDARTGEHNRPYTPHPDFWVAALWRKLMDKRVLGANYTTTTPPKAGYSSEIVPSSPKVESLGGDQWVIVHGQSCDWSPHGNPKGSAVAPLLGKVNTSAECQALCVAHQHEQPLEKVCKSFAWCDQSCGDLWAFKCYGRMDDVWALHPVRGVTSGCDMKYSKTKCIAAPPPPPPPPPPPGPPALRTFAHCSKTTPGAATYAVVVAPCNRTEVLKLQFPGAVSLTTWWLSAGGTGPSAPSADMISLNGKNLTV